jgi:hypothetical protein
MMMSYSPTVYWASIVTPSALAASALAASPFAPAGDGAALVALEHHLRRLRTPIP